MLIPHQAHRRKMRGAVGSRMWDSPPARSVEVQMPWGPQALDAALLSLSFPCLENGEKAARLVVLLRRELLAERGARHTPDPSPGHLPPHPLGLGPRSLRTLCVRGYGDAQSCQVCPCVSLIFQGRQLRPLPERAPSPTCPALRVVSRVAHSGAKNQGTWGAPGLRAPRQRHHSPLGFPVP